MGIEGIGKGGGPPAVAPAAESSRTSAPEATRAFEVPSTPKPAGAPRTEGTAPAPSVDALGSFRSGAVDLDGYLDRKVDEATAHLGGMPASDLALVRAALRERLATDPTLVDLVKSATGSLPHAPEDD